MSRTRCRWLWGHMLIAISTPRGVTAASVALACAGISMRGLVTACSAVSARGYPHTYAKRARSPAPALCTGPPGQSTASVARSDSRGSSECAVLSVPRLRSGDGDRDQSQTRGRMSTSGARRGQSDGQTRVWRIGIRGSTDACHTAQTLTAAREVCALLHGAAQKALLAATAAEENA